MGTTAEAARLWAFSRRLYARPGVAASCLGLQDRRGLDVNMVLACVWLARAGRRLDSDGARRLWAAIEPWQEGVVARLRAARRDIKTMPAAMGATAAGTLAGPIARVRSAIKRQELAAERIESQLIAGALARSGRASAAPGAPLARANLASYLKALGLKPSAADVADLESVVAAAFGPRAGVQARSVAGALLALGKRRRQA